MGALNLLSHFPHLVLCRQEQYASDDPSQVVDSFPDRLLHGGGVEATENERVAVLEALRWPPLSAYTMLALQPPEAQQTALRHFPLSDENLLTLLRAIRDQHLVVQVAHGVRLRQIHVGEAFLTSSTAQLVPTPAGLQATVRFEEQDYHTGLRVPLGPLLPDTEYLVEGIESWDGMRFALACEAVPTMPRDRARMIALGVVYSCLGEPFRPDGSLPPRGQGPLSRFISFPTAIRGPLWAAAEREAFRVNAESPRALLWEMLADAFVEVVTALKVDFATQHLSEAIRVPAPKEGKHWGAWLPPESWNRIRLQSVVLHRVQRVVRHRLLPKSGYQRRGYRAHRHLKATWAALPSPRRRELLRQLRHHLPTMNYRLFRVALRGIPLSQVAERQGLSKTAVSERLHGTVLPQFDRTVRSVRDRGPAPPP